MAKRVPTTEFGDIWADGATPEQNHERWGNHWMAWSWWILVLEQAARIIGEQYHHMEDGDGNVVMPAVLAIRAMLLGYAIECSMKCYWVRKGNNIVENGKFVGVKGAGGDHNLVRLAVAVGFKATVRESDVLARLYRNLLALLGATQLQVATMRRTDRHRRPRKPRLATSPEIPTPTLLSILNKLNTLITETRRAFHPLGKRRLLYTSGPCGASEEVSKSKRADNSHLSS